MPPRTCRFNDLKYRLLRWSFGPAGEAIQFQLEGLNFERLFRNSVLQVEIELQFPQSPLMHSAMRHQHATSFEVHERRSVITREARIAERSELGDGAVHALERKISEGIDVEVLADLIDGLLRADQLFARRHVDAVVARVRDRRRGDAEVDLARAGLADERNEATTGGAAHERIIHHDDAFAVDDLAHRVVLDADAEVAALLRRVDEGAADVVIADEPELVRDAALLGVAERRGVRGVGHTEHAVGSDGLLARKLAAERAPRAVDARAPDAGVGPCEVDELEDAGCRAGRALQRRQLIDAAIVH